MARARPGRPLHSGGCGDQLLGPARPALWLLLYRPALGSGQAQAGGRHHQQRVPAGRLPAAAALQLRVQRHVRTEHGRTPQADHGRDQALQQVELQTNIREVNPW